ncbi:hypothetical protein FRC10_009684 [Ceratobasidium sp. 414]|nr:hypothetical protein FRC10_009684 [Ceratobasidium sp. 414]
MAVDQLDPPPRYRGRHRVNIMVVVNPDHESDSPEAPPRYHPGLANPAIPSRTSADPSPTSPASGSGNLSRPELEPPSLALNHELLPLDLVITPGPARVTSDSPVAESSDNQPKLSARPHHTRRASDSAYAAQSSSTRRSFSPPHRHSHSVSHTPSECTIVSITKDAQNYIAVDITGHMAEAQAIRKHLLSKLAIPDNLHSRFAIYRATLDKFTTGNPLDDDQLLIDCHGLGDSKGSLKFFAHRVGASPRPRPLPPPPPSAGPLQPQKVSRSASPTSNSESGSLDNKVG